MYVSTNRFWQPVSSKLFCLLWLGLGVILALTSRVAVGQEPPYLAGGNADVADAVEDGFLFNDMITGRSGQAYGVLLRAGVLTGPAVGRQESIVPIEAMPYAFIDSAMVFGDIRGFKAMRDGWGVNLGGGVRYHMERFDRIIGANVFYDRDNSSGAEFDQVGFGLETLGEMWDARANAYFPQGTKLAELSRSYVVGSEEFVGHNIIFDQRRISGISLKGVDMEVGVPIPGRIANRHQLKVFGGWYYYDADSISGFAGWKTRIQANLLPSVEMQVEVMNDRVFDTNVVFGAAWSYGGYRQADGVKKSQFGRMTEPVRRMYNVSVARVTEIDNNLIAVNPTTGQPYFIEHVASYATGPIFDGTVENPFLTIPDAQANPNPAGNPGGNIIYVHANSVYDTAPNNSIVLEPTVRVLGEGNGVEHRINIAGLGVIPVPRATAFSDRPILRDSLGNAVTLISGTSTAQTEFSGFQIGDPTDNTSGPLGNGIFGDTVQNVLVTQNSINFAQGDGIRLENLNGVVTFRGNTIDNTGNTDTTVHGLHVIGGTGGVTFIDDPVSGAQAKITNTGGRALLIENTLNGSFVNLTGTDIVDGNSTLGLSGQGILIDNANGAITVDTTTITDSSTTGIDIQGGAADIHFRGVVTIDNPTDDAINIENTQSTSVIVFSNSAGNTITNRNARGLNLSGNSGLVQFTSPLSIAGTAVAPGIEYQGSSGDALFQNITINGGGGDGILVGEVGTNNTGTFSSTGVTNITGFTGNGIFVTDDLSEVLFNNVNIGDRGLSGVNVNNNLGVVDFSGTVIIGNQPNLSTSPAVDIQNNTAGGVGFDVLQIVDANRPVGLGGGSGVNVINNPAAVIIDDLTIDSLDGTALFVSNAGDSTVTPPTGGFAVGTGTINALNGKAVDISDSVISVILESVSSTNSPTQGISLVDNIGLGGTTGILFGVTGLNTVPASGGTINNATLDGVFVQNTGAVSLANMDITSSGISGVFAETDELDLTRMGIDQNAVFGVETLNTPNVSIVGSTLTGNGSSEIRLRTTVVDTFTYVIGTAATGDGNQITDNNANAVVIDNAAGGGGATINLLFAGNTAITTAGAGLDILNIDWTGPANLNISQNSFTFNPTASRAVVIDLPSSTASSIVSIMSNTFLSAGGGTTTGIDLTTGGGQSTITVGRLAGQLLGNQMTFNSGAANGGTAMTFDLGANTSTNIFDNNILMDGDLSQAILFTLIQGPSSVFIDNNVIDIDDGPDLVDDEGGIIIQAISGNVTLFGVQNNDILMYGLRDSIFPFFFAPAGINGSIIVNGATVP